MSGTGVADPNDNHQSTSEKRTDTGDMLEREVNPSVEKMFFLNGTVRATGSVHKTSGKKSSGKIRIFVQREVIHQLKAMGTLISWLPI